MSNSCQIRGKWVEAAFAVAWLKHTYVSWINPLMAYRDPNRFMSSEFGV